MNCPMKLGENAGILLDYAAGKLNAETCAQIERHIETCPACTEFAGVCQALDSWEPPEVSLDFDRRLYTRIDQNVPWWTRLLRPLNPLFRHSVPIGAAAGVVIMAGLLMNRPASAPAIPSAQSAQVETLQPEQVESALDEMEMLREFNHLVPDNGPKM